MKFLSSSLRQSHGSSIYITIAGIVTGALFFTLHAHATTVQTVLGERIAGSSSIHSAENYVIVNESSSTVLSVEGNSLIEGTNVHARSFDGDTAQFWRFTSRGSGTYDIQNCYGGFWLSVQGGSTSNGANIILRNQPNDAWTLEAIGNGLFRIVNTNSGRALSITNGNLVQRDYTGSDSQQWALYTAAAGHEETPDFRMQGWATQNGGTTGGAGGQTVTATTIVELVDYAIRSEPLIIQVSGKLDYRDLPTSHPEWRTNSRIRPVSNKTIIGLGNDAEISRAELRLGEVRNIIVRNIHFSDSPDTSIAVSRDVTNVWIDHCTFTGSPDGAIDFSAGADFATVSWCRFYDEHKVSIVGSFSGDWHPGQYRVTFHHNWFGNNIGQARNPAVSKTGGLHLFNNLYRSPTWGWRFGDKDLEPTEMQVYSEGNYFDSATVPWVIQAPELDNKRFKDIGSIFRRTSSPHTANSTLTSEGMTFNPRDEYSYTVNHVLNVPYLVMTYAGTGVIDPTDHPGDHEPPGDDDGSGPGDDDSGGTEPPDDGEPGGPGDGDDEPADPVGKVAFYPLTAGHGSVAYDKSGFGTPVDLTLTGGTAWVEGGGIRLDGAGGAFSESPATKLAEQIAQSGRFAVEIWARPTSLFQSGPARIVSFSQNTSSRNFTFAHGAISDLSPGLNFRLRTTIDGSDNGLPEAYAPAAFVDAVAHYVVTFDGQTIRVYRDGGLIHSEPRPGALANWDISHALALGNEVGGGRGWTGELYQVAIFDRELDASEIGERFLAGFGNPAEPAEPVMPDDWEVIHTSSGTSAQWTGTTGQAYQVQYSNNLRKWNDHGEPILGDGTLIVVEDLPVLPGRGTFYRLVVSLVKD